MFEFSEFVRKRSHSFIFYRFRQNIRNRKTKETDSPTGLLDECVARSAISFLRSSRCTPPRRLRYSIRSVPFDDWVDFSFYRYLPSPRSIAIIQHQFKIHQANLAVSYVTATSAVQTVAVHRHSLISANVYMPMTWLFFICLHNNRHFDWSTILSTVHTYVE